jgi:exopolyphosphatase/guanosine-5'-triphosphate,3'-diphosphate pyrophosphatase
MRSVPVSAFIRRLVEPAGVTVDGLPRVGVIDVGSNTARLLVAEAAANGAARRIGEARANLGLGAEIVRRGGVGREKLSETARETARLAAIAREFGAEQIDVFVTAPARQADNADELVTTVTRATGLPARVLTAEEEGRLAYEGAVATTRHTREPVAVCDVGGGSTEVTIGDRARGPFWSHGVDLGALRLTASVLHDDPPTRRQLRDAERLANEMLGALRPPPIAAALAVGGTARTLARLTGRRLEETALDQALARIVLQPAVELARSLEVDEARAATLAGGAIILRALTRQLGVPLQLAGGGLRDGAAARLLGQRPAA